MRASSSSKNKSSLTRRFTDMINQKTVRLPSSSRNAGTKEGSTTPPVQTTTPSSSSSSPQSRMTISPQSPRFTFDEQHRLPVTFLCSASQRIHRRVLSSLASHPSRWKRIGSVCPTTGRRHLRLWPAGQDRIAKQRCRHLRNRFALAGFARTDSSPSWSMIVTEEKD